MLLAQRVWPGPAGDSSDLVPFAGAAHAVLPFWRLVADAGYDSEANHRSCRERLRADNLIPAKKRRSVGVAATTPYRQDMVRRLGGAGDEEAGRAYPQRWRAETVMWVLKRRWGEALSARLDPTQEASALLRGVVYNLIRPVRLDGAG
jgi:Transposase DDE domain